MPLRKSATNEDHIYELSNSSVAKHTNIRFRPLNCKRLSTCVIWYRSARNNNEWNLGRLRSWFTQDTHMTLEFRIEGMVYMHISNCVWLCLRKHPKHPKHPPVDFCSKTLRCSAIDHIAHQKESTLIKTQTRDCTCNIRSLIEINNWLVFHDTDVF